MGKERLIASLPCSTKEDDRKTVNKVVHKAVSEDQSEDPVHNLISSRPDKFLTVIHLVELVCNDCKAWDQCVSPQQHPDVVIGLFDARPQFCAAHLISY